LSIKSDGRARDICSILPGEDATIARPQNRCQASALSSPMPPSTRRLIALIPWTSRSAGGLFDAVRNLALEMEEQRRYSTSVVGLDDPSAELDRPLWGRIETTAMRVRGPHAFGYAPDLSRTLRSKNPDLIHVHGLWMYPSVAANHWSRSGKPYVVSPHGMLDPWALENSRWKKRAAGAIYENRHLRGAACLHALNHAEADAIRAYGLSSPICMIPNGVELPEKPRKSDVRETNTLLYLGRLHPKKGLTMLIQAWATVRKAAEATGWRLAVAGWDQNGHRSVLEALASNLGASSTISFPGPQFGEAKAEYFRTASAFILPSLSEGLPISILEAWSWGLPAVLTPQCNLPEGHQAGAAIVVESTVESIVAGLNRLFSMSNGEREAMGALGRRLVEDKFQWSQVARQMTEVYDWILGFGPQPACVMN
jgi:glycosyltransferase involved in cell wall biosynthesis